MRVGEAPDAQVEGPFAQVRDGGLGVAVVAGQGSVEELEEGVSFDAGDFMAALMPASIQRAEVGVRLAAQEVPPRPVGELVLEVRDVLGRMRRALAQGPAGVAQLHEPRVGPSKSSLAGDVGGRLHEAQQFHRLQSAIKAALVGRQVFRVPPPPTRGLAIEVHQSPLVVDQVGGHGGEVATRLLRLAALRHQLVEKGHGVEVRGHLVARRVTLPFKQAVGGVVPFRRIAPGSVPRLVPLLALGPHGTGREAGDPRHGDQPTKGVEGVGGLGAGRGVLGDGPSIALGGEVVAGVAAVVVAHLADVFLRSFVPFELVREAQPLLAPPFEVLLVPRGLAGQRERVQSNLRKAPRRPHPRASPVHRHGPHPVVRKPSLPCEVMKLAFPRPPDHPPGRADPHVAVGPTGHARDVLIREALGPRDAVQRHPAQLGHAPRRADPQRPVHGGDVARVRRRQPPEFPSLVRRKPIHVQASEAAPVEGGQASVAQHPQILMLHHQAPWREGRGIRPDGGRLVVHEVKQALARREHHLAPELDDVLDGRVMQARPRGFIESMKAAGARRVHGPAHDRKPCRPHLALRCPSHGVGPWRHQGALRKDDNLSSRDGHGLHARRRDQPLAAPLLQEHVVRHDLVRARGPRHGRGRGLQRAQDAGEDDPTLEHGRKWATGGAGESRREAARPWGPTPGAPSGWTWMRDGAPINRRRPCRGIGWGTFPGCGGRRG